MHEKVEKEATKGQALGIQFARMSIGIEQWFQFGLLLIGMQFAGQLIVNLGWDIATRYIMDSHKLIPTLIYGFKDAIHFHIIPFLLSLIAPTVFGLRYFKRSQKAAEETTKARYYEGPKLVTEDECVQQIGETREEYRVLSREKKIEDLRSKGLIPEAAKEKKLIDKIQFPVWAAGLATNATIREASENLDRLRKSKWFGTDQPVIPGNEMPDIKVEELPMGANFTAKIQLPVFIWNMNFAFIGAVRSGKTQGITPIVKENYRIGVRMMLHDSKGDFYSICGTPDDLLFCPLDNRHMGKYKGWTLFNDVSQTYEIDLVAKSFFPDQPNTDPFWVDGPRSIFAGILKFCHMSGRTTNKQLWETVCLPLDQISELLKQVPGAEIAVKTISDPKGQTANSLSSVFMSRIQALEYIADSDGEFSIKKWVENPQGNIYVVNFPEVSDALKPVLSSFLDLTMLRILGLPFDPTRRLGFILDELPFLGKLTSLVRFITMSAEKGTQIVMGYQTDSALRAIYGKEDTNTILGCLGSKVICRLADTDTAKNYSEYLGEYTEIRSTRSTVVKGAESQDGITWNEQFNKRPLLSKDDLLCLRCVPPAYYECIVKFPTFDAVKLRRDIVRYEKKEAAFDPKAGVSLDYIREKHEEARKKIDRVLQMQEAAKNASQGDTKDIDKEKEKDKDKEKKKKRRMTMQPEMFSDVDHSRFQ